MENPKTDAALYLMTVLLNELGDDYPELVTNMIHGIRADQDALPEGVSERDHVDAIFAESLDLLHRCLPEHELPE